MIDGVIIDQKKLATVCKITYFSEELKKEIRARLSTICYGPDDVNRDLARTKYKNTLKEFNNRYHKKSDKIKKGMIGELLTHILIFKLYKNYSPINPFFNMEEGSIKKGFDLVIYDNNLDEIWISEVKSGNAQSQKADVFNKSLLNTAKNDLKTRLGRNKANLWHNAINGAKVALLNGSVKERIIEILNDCSQKSLEGESHISLKNVILISVTFKGTNDPITISEVTSKGQTIINEAIFKKVIVFSIQKETYDRVFQFLSSEAES
jgi:hypothetical protein